MLWNPVSEAIVFSDIVLEKLGGSNLGWQPYSNMTIMLWHGMIMVIHTRYCVIMARSWHVHHEYSMIMVWPSWKIAWPCHGDHGHYYNVVRTLNILPTLLICCPGGSPLLFNAEYVEQTHQKLPERHLLKWISFKISKLPEITKSCNIYVILKLLLKKNLLSWYHRRKLLNYREYSLLSFAHSPL